MMAMQILGNHFWEIMGNHFGKSCFYFLGYFIFLFFWILPCQSLQKQFNHHSISPGITPDVDRLNSQRPLLYQTSPGLCQGKSCPNFLGNHEESHIPLGPLGPTLAVEKKNLRWDSSRRISSRHPGLKRCEDGRFLNHLALEHDDIPMSLQICLDCQRISPDIAHLT